MRLLTILLFNFYGFNVLADTCISYMGFSEKEGEATTIASTEPIKLNEFELFGNVIADPINIEFWVEKCVNDGDISYSLFGTATALVSGKSKGAMYYDIAVIQNNKQFDGVVFYGDNLFVPGDFWTALQTTYFSSGSIYSSHTGLDLSQSFTLILSCDNAVGLYYEACSAVNSDHYFEINPQSDINNNVLSTINGAWFDPDHNGSGYNFIQTLNGLQVYFYGYRAGSDGDTLWLASVLGPKTIEKDVTYSLDMGAGFLGNGGSLTTKPTTPNSGLMLWGTAELTFHSCNSGEVILTNTDGESVTHNIILLAGAEGLTCE